MASASSIYSPAYPATAVNDNDRAGTNAGNGGMWADVTANAWPDWVQINFNDSKSIGRVVVYTAQDNIGNPVEPTDALTFTQYGIRDFTVQGWDGANWVTLGSVNGNNLVKRTINFPAYTTDRIRVNVTNALTTFSRIMEIEAWEVPASESSNVALASAGAAALASTTYGPAYPPTA